MPRMLPVNDDMMVHDIPGPGTFQFSGVRPEHLGSAEYTLITIVVDETGSVVKFAEDLLKSVRSIIEACHKHPRSENLMVRLISFNNKVTEIHGFMPLSTIDPKNYKPFKPNGMTALYDACYSAVGATLEYSKELIRQGFCANAGVYIITDGIDNVSGITPKAIAEKIDNARVDGVLESMLTVLMGLKDPGGVNGDSTEKILKKFRKKAELDQYVDAGRATPEKLAKLAAFVFNSISLQSQALGSGVMSQPLTF
ncbi:hypothetical protein QUF76_06745 [Desulfobacterales bacterium HSG16]|nr:hypothetical protein [Desulfobacterales bacterium HSG16]